ncbi:MAG: rod-binding protein [Gemmatimonadaceae bacterium]|nr:rod-binding protein [Gemmatimonadaceae bacterium]
MSIDTMPLDPAMRVPTGTTGAAGANTRLPADADAKLRKAAHDMEAVFVQQLLKAMRDTVPAGGGIVERSQGEELFTGLMDERIAVDTSAQWKRGLGDAIYRALRHTAGLDAPAPATPPSPAPLP